MRKRQLLSQTALCSTILLSAHVHAAMAADAPVLVAPVLTASALSAVSTVNGKFDLAIGGASPGYDFQGFSNGFEWAVRAQGAISIPLTQSFGFQADGVLAQFQNDLFAHAAGHLFYRDPTRMLLGVYGAYSTWSGFDRGRLAGEAEFYLGRFTLETINGWEFGDVPSSFFTITDLAYYPHDNLRLALGFRHNGAGSSLAGGLEYQFTSGPRGWVGFADAEIGNNDYQKLFVGMRFYFGPDKSLIRRHREDDPHIKADERSLTGCNPGGAITNDGINAFDSSVASSPCNIRELNPT